MRFLCCASVALVIMASSALAQSNVAGVSQPSALTMGETFTIQSKTLNETRRINIYLPPAYTETPETRLPVLYMPDGGMAEDFLHVAGLVQVSTGNGTMRPFILVGIENTQRRRDLSGPTENAEDRKVAPVVGGSAAFRTFIRSELMPAIKARYRTTAESAIIGESLAGLFIVETFLLEPGLFDAYIAFDASLWWNNGQLVKSAPARVRAAGNRPHALYLANSREDIDNLSARLADVLKSNTPANLTWHYEPMPAETHATIYHPAALLALRRLFKPAPPPGPSDTLYSVDLYGLRSVPETALRTAIGLRAGDAAPQSLEPIRARVRAIPGVAEADVSKICCSETGRSILYVGIREHGTAPASFRTAPTGSARLPADIIAAGERYDAPLLSAVKRGAASEDDSQGYSLANDSAVRAVQQEFLRLAAQRFDSIANVLRTSSDAQHRALAAVIVAYGTNRPAVADALMSAMSDPDDGVRNNATRALAVLAQWANRNAGSGVTIPAAPFIDFLNSVSWTDRNKGVFVLVALTSTRDAALLAQLRARALPSLIEMAQWTHAGHALFPFLVVARIGGVDEGTAFQAFQAGKRDAIIAKARAR